MRRGEQGGEGAAVIGAGEWEGDGGLVLAGATILLTELPRFNIIYQSIFLFYLIGIHLHEVAADVKNCEFQRNVAFVSFFNNHAF